MALTINSGLLVQVEPARQDGAPDSDPEAATETSVGQESGGTGPAEP